MIEARTFLDPNRPSMTMCCLVELHDPQPAARFPRGTIVTCEAGHEVAEFVANVFPLQMICNTDVTDNRSGQDIWRAVETIWDDGHPATVFEPVPCRCGARWFRQRTYANQVFSEIHTAVGWR